MATKYVTFNYFEPVLVEAEQVLEVELNQENEDEQYQGDLWDMQACMDYLSVANNNQDFSYTLGDEYADVEPGSFIIQGSHAHIQVSKLRETNIPAKKRIGEIKEEILLNDDEYIGEFNSILYDETLQVLMVQSNHYGLSTKQLENYLTELRFRHLESIGHDDVDRPIMVKLNPIIDYQQIEDALRADYYRKIRIRGADLREDAYHEDRADLINEVARTVSRTHGVNIDLQISVGRAERTRSLDNETIRNTLEVFRDTPENRRPNIEVTLLDNEESQIETINLIRPRLHDRVPFTIAPRTIIRHEYVCEKMMETYTRRRSHLRRVLVR